MVMQPDAAFFDGLDAFSGVLAHVQAPDWERPSTCAGWRTLDVLGHVGLGVRFGTALLLGDAQRGNRSSHRARSWKATPFAGGTRSSNRHETP